MICKQATVKAGRRNSRFIQVAGKRYRAPKGAKLTCDKAYPVIAVNKGSIILKVGAVKVRAFLANDLVSEA